MIERMRTINMKEKRMKEKAALIDTSGYSKALFTIGQFNQLKKIARNLSLFLKSIQSISVDIMIDIIDELSRDRKIMMVIKDLNQIKEYIKIDLNDDSKSPEKLRIIQEKQDYHKELANKLGKLQVNYMFKTINNLSEFKATCLDPRRFFEKQDALEVKEKNLKSQGINCNGHDDEMMGLLQRKFTIQQNGIFSEKSESLSDDDSKKSSTDDEEEPMLRFLAQSYLNIRREIAEIGAQVIQKVKGMSAENSARSKREKLARNSEPSRLNIETMIKNQQDESLKVKKPKQSKGSIVSPQGKSLRKKVSVMIKV